jgi:hypothetical protein
MARNIMTAQILSNRANDGERIRKRHGVARFAQVSSRRRL